MPWASSPPAGSDSPGAESRTQIPPSIRSASKARSATPVSTVAIVSASAGLAGAEEAAVVEPFEGQLLDRGPGPVGVEADLAEEDPVGPGDRPFPQPDRVRAVEAVRELAQAAADRLGALAGSGLDLDPGDPEAGELGGEVRRHPALPGDRPRPLVGCARLRSRPSQLASAAAVAASRSSTRCSSWAALSSPTLALCRVPPG